ncbi:MAG: serine/threonine-protein kinase RsbW [Solirubrobacteraceae bacterium]|jgi:serine/threonine-protein kinase RsbW/stage II sporulation protein AB (anti-sigma F factor)|nr:serine/threonine-protein kinase RsbW [Solirubrobacteraceae bacterium]
MVHQVAATYEATPENVGLLRDQMAAMARECGLDETGIADVRLAVSEAATNALIHGCRRRPGIIRAHAEITDGELRIAICDDGPGMAPRTDSPGLGLGLPVIASVSRRLEILQDDPGTELRMAFDCPASAAPGSLSDV